MENLEVSNLIIVESQNDKAFIEKLVLYLGITKVTKIDYLDYKCLDGLGHFAKKIKEIKYDRYNKIGIIIDADNEGIQNRIDFINQQFKNYYSELSSDDNSIDKDELIVDHINELKFSNNLEVEFAVYVTNVAGKGELETLLKSIKSKNSDYADCLEAWRSCLKTKSKSISNKDFDKFWINNYLRFDTCSNQEKKQANRKCSGEYAIKKDIWDLNHANLSDLKTFLQLF